MSKETIGARLNSFLLTRFPDAKSQRERCKLLDFPYTTILGWLKDQPVISTEGILRVKELGGDIEWLLLGTSTKKAPTIPTGAEQTIDPQLFSSLFEAQMALGEIGRKVLQGQIAESDAFQIIGEVLGIVWKERDIQKKSDSRESTG